jgi:hypothetical protein
MAKSPHAPHPHKMHSGGGHHHGHIMSHHGTKHGKDPLAYHAGNPKGRPEASVGKGDTQVYPASQDPHMHHEHIDSHESGTHHEHGRAGYNPGKHHHNG